MMNRILIPVSLFMFAIGLYMVGVSQRPWAPRNDVVQPIPFSHRVHAGINKIPCQYCHELRAARPIRACRQSSDVSDVMAARCSAASSR
jgi:hypothetical protein